MEDEVLVAFGDEVKTLDDGSDNVHVRGYLVRFGTPEEHDATSKRDFFTSETDYGFKSGDVKRVPVYFNHTMPMRARDNRVIVIDAQVGEATLSFDEKGIIADAILYNRAQYEKEIAGSYKSMAWSSGVASHIMRRKDRENGTHEVTRWIIAEASVTPMPGEPRKENRLYSVKSLSEELPEMADNPTNLKNTEKKKMPEITNESVQEQINAALKAQRDAAEAEAVSAKARQDEIDAAVKTRTDELEEKYAKIRRLPEYDGAPYATKFNDRKFDNLDAADMSMLVSVLQANGKKPSQSALKSLGYKLLANKNAPAHVTDALKFAGYATEDAIKAAEVMATTDSGNGSDWVGAAYSNAIWESIRHDGGIVSRLPEVIIPDGFASQYFPLEDADPSWYKVGETTAKNATTGVPDASIPDSKMGTANKQLTVSKIGARVMYAGEMIEDSLIPFASQLRLQLEKSGSEIMEAIVINGDTETGAAANINTIAAAPAGNEWFMLANGFRKLALVTNSANARDAGVLAIEDYLETMKLMGVAGMSAIDITKVAFIVDANTYWKTQELTEVKNRDYGNSIVVENGFVTRLYGVSLLPSWQMHKGSAVLKANAAGKVDITVPANNTTGSILCVRPDQWKLGYKRRMTIETTRRPESDSWDIVALARFGLAYRDVEAAAISYNVTV